MTQPTAIHPTCPKCGKVLRIELPGYDQLVRENAALRDKIRTLEHGDTSRELFNRLFGGGL